MAVTCLFDIDGTLIDAGGAGNEAMKLVLAEVFGIRQITGRIPTAGRTDAAITSDLLEQHGIEPDRVEEFRDAYTEALPHALRRLDGRVLDGVAQLIEQLESLNSIRLGLLTGNFEAAAWQKLDHFGLSDSFSFGAFGDDHVNRDDVARRAMHVAAERFGSIDSTTFWVIGDTPSDVRCARAVNARVAAVATGIFNSEQLAETEPDVLLESLAESQPLLDAMGL